MKNNSLTCNTSKNMIQLQVKTECLLSKYKNENCLFQGILAINSIKKNKNQINNIKTFNINSLTGKGSLYLQNGKKFEGNFINGELNGWCRYISDKAICYEGLFIDGVLNGKGEIITINEPKLSAFDGIQEAKTLLIPNNELNDINNDMNNNINNEQIEKEEEKEKTQEKRRSLN